MSNEYPDVLAYDFDGYIVENEFPDIGSINDIVVEHMREEKNNGSIIIIWTCRDNEYKKEMRDFLIENNIPFDYINENINELDFETSDKIYADVYHDDRGRNMIREQKIIDRLKNIKSYTLGVHGGIRKLIEDIKDDKFLEGKNN